MFTTLGPFRLLMLVAIFTSAYALHIPHYLKMNVSQEEYTRTFHVYLSRIRHKQTSPSSYEKTYFLTFTHSGYREVSLHSTVELDFRMQIGSHAIIDRSTLRLLVSGEECSQLRFYQIEGGRKTFLETKIPTKELLPQWIDVKVLPAVSGARLAIEAPGCKLSNPAIHLLLKRKPRTRRSSVHRRNYCYGSKKPRCCRHKMNVVFKELPGYEFIIQPEMFDAGYCKGGCPYRFNRAHNHASLQSLIWHLKKGAAPKPCCAPSKLEQLEIIHLDENDPTKLKVSTWNNMKVIECACF